MRVVPFGEPGAPKRASTLDGAKGGGAAVSVAAVNYSMDTSATGFRREIFFLRKIFEEIKCHRNLVITGFFGDS
jgi:hypothetical protein